MLNVLLFLTPKKDVAYLEKDFTIRQALEKMEHYRYTSMPIINDNGKYIGSLSEGDLLYYVKNEYDLNLKDAEDTPILNIHRHKDYETISAECELADVYDKAMNQNFIPVEDDRKHFIGIITRKNILNYFKGKVIKEI